MRTVSEWLQEQLDKYEGDVEAVKKLYSKFKKELGSKASQESYYRYLRESYDIWITNQIISDDDDDYDLSEEDYIKIAAQKQKLQDKNRVVSKHNREINRVYNFLDEMYTSYKDLMSSVDLSKIKLKKHNSKKAKYGVLQLSDLHLNERIIDEGIGNEYSFTIASKRLKKFVSEAKDLFKMKGITDVLIINSGDMINSDRRLSEKMVKSTALTSASLLATQLISQVIIDIGQDFAISFLSVVGNESRIGDFYESIEFLLSENWDYLISENIRLMFSNNKNFTFIDGENHKEKTFKLGNFTGLVTHGDNFSIGNPEKSVREYIAKFTIRGVPIHGVFAGHIHSAIVGDFFSRSASLCGTNPYAGKTLGLYGRASQNCYIINDDESSYNGYKIDLQDVQNVIGYDISDQLKRYNVNEGGSNVEVTIKRYKA